VDVTATTKAARPKTITVADIKTALDHIVAEAPDRTDRRIEDHLNPRYLDHGQPTCLVALLLIALGYRTALLRDLDREHSVGHVAATGVRIAESRHPALKRLDPKARTLLQFLQTRQDRGMCWDYIAEQAFKPRHLWTLPSTDRRARPWLY
jgi:hypothetical protein